MYRIYLAVLAIVFSCACHRKLNTNVSSGTNGTNTTNDMKNGDSIYQYHDPAVHLDTRGNPMLLGIHPAEDLERAPYGDWFNKNYADYTVDSATAGALRPLLKGKTFELYMGTWCGDSKREIPRMLKILRYAGVRPGQSGW